jgi:hypothetical protein
MGVAQIPCLSWRLDAAAVTAIFVTHEYVLVISAPRSFLKCGQHVAQFLYFVARNLADLLQDDNAVRNGMILNVVPNPSAA